MDLGFTYAHCTAPGFTVQAASTQPLKEINMYAPEQIAATNKAGVEAILGFAHSQFAAFERLSALHFNATKSAFEDSVNHA